MAEEQEPRSPPKYGQDNTAPDGSYIVGKGKPPEHGKFRKGDKRKRGRRGKGTRNLATDFQQEMQDLVTVTVGGQQRRVSKQRSLIMRLIDNASRGQNSALKLALEYGGKFDVASERPADSLTAQEAYPCMSDLSEDELAQLGVLLSKATGVELPPPPSNPFAYIHDPNDARNNITESTIDGILYRRCSVPDHGDEVLGIANRAYWSAALPRKSGCNRHRL